MAKRKAQKPKSKISVIVLLIIALVVVIGGRATKMFESPPEQTTAAAIQMTDDEVKVHFIDVGQGLSALIQCGETGILIDAGEKKYADKVIAYLNDCSIDHLEYVVASHPHTDHIGAMEAVLDAFAVENIIMPELSEINTPTTKTYEGLLEKIIEKEINVIAASYGAQYRVGNAVLEIFGPVEQVKDINNMSVICKVRACKTQFLFPGDAEVTEMKTIDKLSPDLKCDVMVMAHHASNTSLDEVFLSSACAKAAVISCGKGNSYGHPHEEALDYLKKNNIEYYRTDYIGNIIFDCKADGYTVSSEY